MARLRSYTINGPSILHPGHYTNTADLLAAVLELKADVLSKKDIPPSIRRYAAATLDALISDLVRLMSS